MQRSFGGNPFDLAEEPRDKELTLGPALLTALGVGLLALCAVCFFAGYAVGHRATPELATTAAGPNGPSAAQLLSNQQSKPSATDQRGSASSAAQTATDNAGVDGASPDGVASSGAAGQASVVQAALPGQQGGVQPAVASEPGVHAALPATAANGAWMVQIAAVSHSEDADVLVSALRKRGYSVSPKRDPMDNLIHVQVGPFSTHTDASTMRQKLLNDGYNAIIQP